MLYNKKFGEVYGLGCFSRTSVLAEITHTYILAMRTSAIILKET
jgi:hypothetical protein